MDFRGWGWASLPPSPPYFRNCQNPPEGEGGPCVSRGRERGKAGHRLQHRSGGLMIQDEPGPGSAVDRGMTAPSPCVAAQRCPSLSRGEGGVGP
jgi:hypothetical protein